MSPRRKSRHGHLNHERWLVSYADFITLLFACFVVLYSSAQVDQRKVGKLAAAIQAAFQQLGILHSAPTARAAPLTAIPSIAIAPPPATASQNQFQTDPEDEDLSTLRLQLQDALKNEISLRQVALHPETQGLVISMKEFGFFDSGSATLRPGALPTLDRIASLLVLRTYSIRVEGHTDNVPIKTPRMASNWELSAARATEVTRLLIERYRFDPNRLSAAGYGEYHPVAGNDTEQGRAMNRRVDIVVLK